MPTHSRKPNKAALPRRALIAVSGATAPLGKEGESTGLFISEALHPYNALRAAGFDVVLSSETGSYRPDSLSLREGFLHGEDIRTWTDSDSEFRRALDSMPKAAGLDPSSFGLFYASAGHAALIDYPTATNLQRLASAVWAKGGVVASVCHGLAMFAGVTEGTTGELIIKSKRVTGSTNEGEDALGVMEQLKTWKKELVEEMAARVGARYERSEGPWDDFHVVDGRLVTGQNPASAASTAKAAIEVFENL